MAENDCKGSGREQNSKTTHAQRQTDPQCGIATLAVRFAHMTVNSLRIGPRTLAVRTMLMIWCYHRREGSLSLRTMKKMATIPTALADPYVTNLLGKISEGKHVLNLLKGEKVFSQGDRADALFFIQTGKVKMSVVSPAGKEAVVTVLGGHNFLGEGALVGQSLRISTATVLEPSVIFRIERLAMVQALHEQPELSEKFIAALLVRNIDLEGDLCDQLFNHSEKRLARVLLKLARLREHDVAPDAKVPMLSHEILAEMVGTTRSRITHFMNKFRTMGLIDYNGELTVRTELLTDLVLHD
jgi:CRP/FNR family cyclic AMP-dependent transcriptional regulator